MSKYGLHQIQSLHRHWRSDQISTTLGYPWLPPDELGTGFFAPLTPLSAEHRSLILMVVLTVLRVSNVRGMKWEWLMGYPDADTGTISIPAEDMKTRRPFRIPLTPLLIELLGFRQCVRRSTVYIWPGITDPLKPFHTTGIQNMVQHLTDGRATLHGLRKTCRT